MLRASCNRGCKTTGRLRAAEFVLNLADVRLNSILITSDREHHSAVGRMRPGNAQTLFSGISPADDATQAARLARKCSRAFFPSLAASAMLSKKTGERSSGADLPAQ